MGSHERYFNSFICTLDLAFSHSLTDDTWRSQVDELQSTLNKEQKNPVDLDATALVGADGRPAELMSVDT
jgi:hypothetical protein